MTKIASIIDISSGFGRDAWKSVRGFVLPIIALAALIFGVISVVRSQPRREVTTPPSPPPVSSYAQTVAAVGLVETSTENIVVGTEIAGVVTKIYVDVGSRVKVGDPLFSVDSRATLAELATRHAAVQVAAAALAEAKYQLELGQRLTEQRVLSVEENKNRGFAAQKAEAQLAQACAQLKSTETDLERLTVRAPVDGQVLQVKVHLGEFAPTGALPTPLILLGSVDKLHVRVDVEEHEAWRVLPEARAAASVRGNADLKTPLTFVRFEPFVLPKKSLTGDSTERVDTRVLQVIYRIDDQNVPLFVGQQMDVFIDAGNQRHLIQRNVSAAPRVRRDQSFDF
ncbi:MAG TPA: efflux RND transporter periplasmic adaptor subunit [Candidatus Udaeobacter sp.]|nr:efflux RND transporter periplasmic adaptor subunit [Candidatus Udaeobacter sp.]